MLERTKGIIPGTKLYADVDPEERRRRHQTYSTLTLQHADRRELPYSDGGGGVFSFTQVAPGTAQGKSKQLSLDTPSYAPSLHEYSNSFARQAYLMDKNVNIQSQKALKLLQDIQTRQSRALNRQHASSLARLKKVQMLNHKFEQFHERKAAELEAHDDMEPTQLDKLNKMVQRHTKSHSIIKTLKLERKYEIEAKKMQTIEKFKRNEQTRKASEAEHGHKLTNIAQRLEEKVQKSEQKLQEQRNQHMLKIQLSKLRM